MVLEDLAILSDFSIGMVALFIIYVLGKQVSQNAFKQVDEANVQLRLANKRGEEIYDRFNAFIQESYNETNLSITKLCDLISEDMKLKEKKLDIIDEYKEMLKEEMRQHNKKVPVEYRN